MELFDQVWHDTVNAEGWELLPHDHPAYSIQQEFCEVACRSRETNHDTLFNLAIEDYRAYHATLPEEITKAFRKWSAIQADNNERMANDSWMKGLEAAEEKGQEATDKFLADNPRGPFQPLGKD